MPLDWEPETIDAAIARLPAAFARLWVFDAAGLARLHADAVALMPRDDRPGMHREHVFDVVAPGRLLGIRFIASRDQVPLWPFDVLHASVSVHHRQPETTTKDIYAIFRPLVEPMGLTRMHPNHCILREYHSPGGITHIWCRKPPALAAAHESPVTNHAPAPEASQ